MKIDAAKIAGGSSSFEGEQIWREWFFIDDADMHDGKNLFVNVVRHFYGIMSRLMEVLREKCEEILITIERICFR